MVLPQRMAAPPGSTASGTSPQQDLPAIIWGPVVTSENRIVHPKLHVEDTGDTITIRVSTGALPDPHLLGLALAEAHATFSEDRTGVVADYIPALARVSPDLFGISVVGVEGGRSGLATETTCSRSRASRSHSSLLWSARRSSRSGSATGSGSMQPACRSTSVMAVELNADRTMNPMVNAGAIATTSCVPGATAEEKFRFIQDGLSRAGRQLEIDQEVYESEAATNLRNRGIAVAEGGRMYWDALEATDIYTASAP
ncbi:MAG: glutaminase [Candidatus Binatia bacterium]